MPEPSGFTEVHQAIKADFMDRLPGYHKIALRRSHAPCQYRVEHPFP